MSVRGYTDFLKVFHAPDLITRYSRIQLCKTKDRKHSDVQMVFQYDLSAPVDKHEAMIKKMEMWVKLAKNNPTLCENEQLYLKREMNESRDFAIRSYFILTPHFSFQSIQEYRKNLKSTIPIEKIKEWYVDLLDTIKVLHENNFLHQNINDTSVLIDSNGNLKLTQPGLGFEDAIDFLDDTDLFIDPYVFDDEKFTKSSDLFSVSSFIYNILCGFDEEGEILDEYKTEEKFINLLKSCTDEEIDNRPETLPKILEELETFEDLSSIRKLKTPYERILQRLEISPPGPVFAGSGSETEESEDEQLYDSVPTKKSLDDSEEDEDSSSEDEEEPMMMKKVAFDGKKKKKKKEKKKKKKKQKKGKKMVMKKSAYSDSDDFDDGDMDMDMEFMDSAPPPPPVSKKKKKKKMKKKKEEGRKMKKDRKKKVSKKKMKKQRELKPVMKMMAKSYVPQIKSKFAAPPMEYMSDMMEEEKEISKLETLDMEKQERRELEKERRRKSDKIGAASRDLLEYAEPMSYSAPKDSPIDVDEGGSFGRTRPGRVSSLPRKHGKMKKGGGFGGGDDGPMFLVFMGVIFCLALCLVCCCCPCVLTYYVYLKISDAGFSGTREFGVETVEEENLDTSESEGEEEGEEEKVHVEPIPPKFDQKQDGLVKKNSYKVKSQIGQGGQSSVYLVEKDGETWTMKRYKRGTLDEFKAEVVALKLLAENECKRVVQFKEDFGYSDEFGEECRFIIMEYCGKGDLQKVIRKKVRRKKPKRLEESYIYKLIEELSVGILEVHDRALIHHDLKSPNIFVTSNFEIRIGDFGFCIKENSKTVGVSGGSPKYMSFEAAGGTIGKKYLDIWCLGTLFVELIQCKVIDMKKKSDEDRIEFIKNLWISSEKVKELIMLCFEVEPEKRISAQLLVQKMREIMEDMKKKEEEEEVEGEGPSAVVIEDVTEERMEEKPEVEEIQNESNEDPKEVEIIE